MAKILVVDDEEHIRLLLKETLTALGFDAITAEGGYRLLERIEKENPDLVTLDIKMPEHDGLDLLQDIRNEFVDLPVIILSAYDSFKEDMRSIPADFYLVKSFDLNDLIVRIKMSLEASGTCSNDIQKIESCAFRIFENFTKNYLNSMEKDPSPQSQDQILATIKQSGNLLEGAYLNEWLACCSNQDVQALFLNIINDFSRDLMRARKLIKQEILKSDYSVEITEIPQLYNKLGPWSVLSHKRFRKEFQKVVKELDIESSWLYDRLKKVVEQIKNRDYSKFPYEDLKRVLLMKSSLELVNSDNDILNIIFADIRHDIKRVQRLIHIKADHLKEEIEHLESIYKRLYSISFFKLQFDFEKVDVNNIIENIIHFLGLYDTEFFKVVKEIQDLELFTDSNLLEIALKQVVQNATEAIDSRGQIIFTVKPDEVGRKIKFLIEDSGKGIREDLLEDIFKPSFTYDKEGHSGMGLSLAQHAIKCLGGSIKIESKVGEGTRVQIIIPTGVSHE
jgi:DNA-binding response OmpR family regulator/signal transduction histidine kinase